ncbi:glycolipid transfer protein 1 isoform X2 [Aplysia californica]|uniref:Glycolipid transfer protein 1 isoform X2 n=1 Tax=Aplysia californica TaxID=6500 RepID=A0ABM1ABG3_APLCA|nr:glycolipid transfer protein 1 isoform X2 [Aplysia californica]
MSELTGDSGPNALQQFTDKTAFGVNEKFDAVDNNSEMATAQFLKACVDITSILDRLGTGFSVPKKDIVGNIKRIDEKFKSNPEKYSTLKVIIQDEAQVQAKSSKITSLAAALIWLRRALSFLLSFISLLSKEYHAGVGEQNLRQTVVTAYQGTLKPFHGRMTQFLFSDLLKGSRVANGMQTNGSRGNQVKLHKSLQTFHFFILDLAFS